MLNNCHWLFSTNHLPSFSPHREKTSRWMRSESGQIRTDLANGSFQGIPRQVSSDNSLRMVFWGTLNLLYSLQWLSDHSWFSLWLQEYWFSSLLWCCDGGNGCRLSSKCHKAILTKIQHFFFFNKPSFDCCRPLVNFQSFERVDSDHFSQCFYGTAAIVALIVCMEDWLFRSPYSASLINITPI